MRKILEIKELPLSATSDPWNWSTYPSPGIYRFLPGPGESLPAHFTYLAGTEYFEMAFIVGSIAESITGIRIDMIKAMPDAPEVAPAASERPRHFSEGEWSPGSMVVPAGSGFVSEAGLIEICRALAHCPPNAPGQ